MAPRPSRMFEVLRDCGALARLLPEPALDAAALARLDAAAAHGAALPVRFALLGWADEAAVTRAAERLRASAEVRELAQLFAREGARLAAWRAPKPPPQAADAEQVLALFERCDALRRPERFAALLEAAGWWAPARAARNEAGAEHEANEEARESDAAREARRSRECLRRLLDAARGTDTASAAAAAARAGARGPAVGQAVRQARLQALLAAWAAAAREAPR